MAERSILADGDLKQLGPHYSATGAALSYLGSNPDALGEALAAIDARDGNRLARVLEPAGLPVPFEEVCVTITKTVVIIRVGTPEYELRRVCRWASTGQVVGGQISMLVDEVQMALSPEQSEAMFNALVAAGIIVCTYEWVKVSDGTSIDIVEVSREVCPSPYPGPGPLRSQ